MVWAVNHPAIYVLIEQWGKEKNYTVSFPQIFFLIQTLESTSTQSTLIIDVTNPK